jgi:hypothetical protein
VTGVYVREDVRERIKRRLERLKNDIRLVQIVENYPVVKDFLENTRPYSVASFGGYIKLMRSAENVNEEVKQKFKELEHHYLDLLNEKLAEVGGCWVTIDEEGYTILNYIAEDGVRQIKLGFNDVMNIYGGRNLDQIVEKIIERAEGRYYNTKYVELGEVSAEVRV